MMSTLDEAFDELDEIAYEMFARAHSHEAHAEDPEWFWQFFHRECPTISRERMEQMLSETAEEAKVTDG